jgi:hypothetical protein
MNCKKKIKAIDQHGAPVALNYDGRVTHRSVVGGVVTILSRIGILGFFLSLVNDVVSK